MVLSAAVARIGRVDRTYLLRGWLIGAGFTAFLWHTLSGSTLFLTFGLANALLMPYAKLAWDQARDFVLGDGEFFTFGILMLIGLVLKVVVNALLWFFALLVAPLGIIYLLVRR